MHQPRERAHLLFPIVDARHEHVGHRRSFALPHAFRKKALVRGQVVRLLVLDVADDVPRGDQRGVADVPVRLDADADALRAQRLRERERKAALQEGLPAREGHAAAAKVAAVPLEPLQKAVYV